MDYGAVDPKFVDYLNVPFATFIYSPAQLISKLINKRVEQSLLALFNFLMPSPAFLTLLAASCLVYWLSSALFSHLPKPPRRRLQLKILAFFYLLFLFFIHEFFSDNLNTSNVIVKTSDLLDSIDQILRTQKELCFLENGPETNFMRNVSFSYLFFQRVLTL